MINRKKASRLATLALAGSVLAGCGGKPKAYRTINEDEIVGSAVPISIYPAPEADEKTVSIPSEFYIWDLDKDGEADAIGFGVRIAYIAEGYNGRGDCDWGISRDTITMPQEVRKQVTHLMNESQRVGVLLTNLQVEQLKQNQVEKEK